MVGIWQKNHLAALNTIISHRPMVNDFEFIQPFGWIRIIIAWGRKSQNNPSGLNMVSTREVC
jgi:hypothetical protein